MCRSKGIIELMYVMYLLKYKIFIDCGVNLSNDKQATPIICLAYIE